VEFCLLIPAAVNAQWVETTILLPDSIGAISYAQNFGWYPATNHVYDRTPRQRGRPRADRHVHSVPERRVVDDRHRTRILVDTVHPVARRVPGELAHHAVGRDPGDSRLFAAPTTVTAFPV
jgi:hypothetical protein